MPLRSHGMALTGPERSWLPWFGAAGKLSMGWACWINDNRYAQLEDIFDSLADTRRKLALWRYDYNNVRPHSSLGNQTPAEARRALEQSEGSAPAALAQPETDDYQKARLSL